MVLALATYLFDFNMLSNLWQHHNVDGTHSLREIGSFWWIYSQSYFRNVDKCNCFATFRTIERVVFTKWPTATFACLDISDWISVDFFVSCSDLSDWKLTKLIEFLCFEIRREILNFFYLFLLGGIRNNFFLLFFKLHSGCDFWNLF